MMLHVQAAALESISHEVASLDWGVDARLDQIEAQARKMSAVTAQVVERFSPAAQAPEAERERPYKIVDAMVELVSAGITQMRAEIEARKASSSAAPEIVEAMMRAHDAWVDDYYSLLALRADLDTDDAKQPTPVPQDIDAWLEELLNDDAG